ncbi:hypothetical protein GCM10023083_54000 [Streptomyces phyllanthi]
MERPPRLICVAGDFTRYDAHVVREHRRSIDLVRYRFFGTDFLGLETVASATRRASAARPVRRGAAGLPHVRGQGGALAELAEAVDEVLLGLGDGVSRVQRKQYRAYQRLWNFACVCPPQKTKLLVYLRADPKEVDDLVPSFTRDVMGLGHHGTGDLAVRAGCGPLPGQLRGGVAVWYVCNGPTQANLRWRYRRDRQRRVDTDDQPHSSPPCEPLPPGGVGMHRSRVLGVLTGCRIGSVRHRSSQHQAVYGSTGTDGAPRRPSRLPCSYRHPQCGLRCYCMVTASSSPGGFMVSAS